MSPANPRRRNVTPYIPPVTPSMGAGGASGVPAAPGVPTSSSSTAGTAASSSRAPSFAPTIVLPDTLAFARRFIRDVPDFPKPGIMFKDITPLLANPRAFHIILDSLAERLMALHIEAVVGIEARGFIFGGALAARLNASFVPARKPGKLPAQVDRIAYQTEYSVAELEMHKASINPEARVAIIDDVLATGGTAKATADLVAGQGGQVVAYGFVIELSALGGREQIAPVKIESVLVY